MANTEVKVRINVSDGGSMRTVSANVEGLGDALQEVQREAQNVNGALVNWGQASTALSNLRGLLGELQSAVESLGATYREQQTQEAKLAQVMRNTMDATDAQIDNIKALCDAQERSGIVAAEVQLAGAQEMATYLELDSSLERLIPVMNDMVAQQYGLEASGESAAQIATMLGKVMNGQVAALSRYGYSFTEAQQKVLLFGEESERAAVLAAVIEQSVGGMNRALAQTEVGQQKQLQDRLDEIKDTLGGMTNAALPFVSITAQSLQAASGLAEMAKGVGTLTSIVRANGAAWAAAALSATRHKVATMASAAAAGVVKTATAAWTAVQRVLNVVLTANPIGLVVTAIGALVAGMTYAYSNCSSFRDIINQLWAAVQPLASALMDGLVKALSWVIEKAKVAWSWLKNILGLDGEEAEVSVRVNSDESESGLADIEAKYAGMTLEGEQTVTYDAKASTLEGITNNIKILQERLQKASLEEAAELNQSIKQWQDKADAIQQAGLEAKESGGEQTVTFDADASTLGGITSNIEVLQAQLQTASLEEAALLNQSIQQWQAKADAIRNAGIAAASSAAQANVAFDAEATTLAGITNNIKILQDQLQTASLEEAAGLNQSIKQWQDKADAIRGAGTEARSAVKPGENAKEAMGGIVSTMNSLSQMVGESAAGWLQWGGNLLSAIGSAIPAILSLSSAQKVQATSNTAAAATGAASSQASIPYVGPILAVAAVASVLAALANLPKFANGGLMYGPTLGIMGEYAGAANNPEVVAPLSKLRQLISTEGDGLSGKVVFRQRGRVLEGVLERENRYRART
jgi:hypothetical protein